MPLEVEWQLGPDERSIFRRACGDGPDNPYTVDGKAVLLLRYDLGRDQEVTLFVRSTSALAADDLRFTITNLHDADKSATVDDPEWRRGGATVLVAGNTAAITIPVAVLLALPRAHVNLNVFVATVRCGGQTAITKVLLHVIQQKAIVLFPGVMATEIHINGSKCWPQPVGTASSLALLACNDQGVPLRAPSKLQVIAGLASDGLYQITAWTKRLNGSYPPLLRAGQPVWHVYLQEYPYDWRPRIELLVDTLLGANGDVAVADLPQRPAWATPPSLWSIIEGLKLRSPFFADKVAVAGHSTGGMVLNALMRQPEARQLVSKVFFIATPFYGAIKPYYAVLRGTMMLGAAVEWLVLDASSFKTLGCNLPVLYYLAPTKLYPRKVACINGRNFVRLGQSAGDVTEMLMSVVNQLRKSGDPFLKDNAQSWNRDLQRCADAFHRACKAPLVIPAERCRVYYTSFRTKGNLRATLGPITYETGKGLAFDPIDGDGTVPMDSLKGPFGEESLCRIDANLDHTGIMASDQLWDDIAMGMMQLVIGCSDYRLRRPGDDGPAVDDALENFLASVPLLPPRAPNAPRGGYGTFD
jgi:hypothetical protein